MSTPSSLWPRVARPVATPPGRSPRSSRPRPAPPRAPISTSCRAILRCASATKREPSTPTARPWSSTTDTCRCGWTSGAFTRRRRNGATPSRPTSGPWTCCPPFTRRRSRSRICCAAPGGCATPSPGSPSCWSRTRTTCRPFCCWGARCSTTNATSRPWRRFAARSSSTRNRWRRCSSRASSWRGYTGTAKRSRHGRRSRGSTPAGRSRNGRAFTHAPRSTCSTSSLRTRTAMAIEGPLRELGIHDVFQLLDLSRKTGLLRVTSELRHNAGTIYFDDGKIIFAEIRSNPHPLGALLLRTGKISEADLERARDMQQRQGDKRRLGEILVSLGAITPRELQRQVRFQVEEVVFEVMSWREGYFSFTEGPLTDVPTEAMVSIPTEALLMEGARRIDEWSRIEGRIPHLGVVPTLAPPQDSGMEGGGGLDLLPPEWEM